METKTEQAPIENIYAGASRAVNRWPSSHGLIEHYPTPDNAAAFRSYFDQEGFIVVRNAVPRALCQDALDAFWLEVKTSRLPFLRHEFFTMDEHVFTEGGFMKYPIMYIQNISGRRFGRFKSASLEVFTHVAVQRAVEALFGEPGRLVSTMFFEGNQNTWPHRDCRYVDAAEEKGRLLGVVVAAEDIDPGTGGFYVSSRSHVTTIADEEDQFDPNGPEYKQLLKDFVVNGPCECVAPILKQGDIVIFSSRAIHGSLTTTDFSSSRSTFNAHWIPASHSLWQLNGDAEPAQSLRVNGVRITSYWNQHSPARMLKWRIKKYVKKTFPQIGKFKEKVSRIA